MIVNGVLALEVGVSPVEEEIELGGGDIRVMIARIINVALGLLGIVALLLILYGGFLWMTAGGEAEQVEKAKRVLINSVIGLAIILSSFAISQFVLNSLVEATIGPGGGPSGPSGPGGGIPGGGVRVFQTESITPQGSIPIRNTVVRALFNADVDSTTVEDNIIISRVSDGARVEGDYEVYAGRVSFTPAAACPAPNEDRNCFDADTEYRVLIGEGLRSTAGLFVNCGGFGALCEAMFTTGNLVDVEPPTVEVSYPDNGQGVPVNSIITLQATSSDDAGVSGVDFEIDGEYYASDGPGAPTPVDFTAETDWDTSGYTVGSRASIRARAFDIDDNSELSSSVSVTIRAEHCFNGVQDEGETGIDCGGDIESVDYCGACAGGSCTESSECSSGYCLEGVCVSLPIIESIDPIDGAPGTMVTLSGQYFGASRGEVVFLGTPEEGDELSAPMAPCGNPWTNNQVIVTVPEGAVSGPIEIVSAAGDRDASDNERGPLIPDFLINTVSRPGICEISPESGEAGSRVSINGAGFGDSEDTVNFGEIEAGRIDSWSVDSIEATVPPLSSGEYPVRVSVAGILSNEISFEVTEAGLAGEPVIASVDPGSGPVGEYVTILGSDFGSSAGRIIFTNPSTGQSALGDVDFPEECGDDFWYRDNITVKVPEEYSDGNPVGLGSHQVTVVRSDSLQSDSVDFIVNGEELTPGICRLAPNVGPVGTEVAIFGERLGDSPGTVTFFDGVAAEISEWLSDQIATEVPSGAQTGPVSAATSAGAASNSLNFKAENCLEEPGACEADQQCCADGTCLPLTEECEVGPREASFVWRFSTGIIPITPQVIEACASGDLPASPSPWSERSGGESVCINAMPTVRFNVPMDASRFTSDNIEFKKCVGAGEDVCSATVDVVVRNIAALGENRGFQIMPDSDMDSDSWYLVNLSTRLRGDSTVGEIEMEQDPDCAEGYGYCYRWKTAVTEDPCVIGGVSVMPGYTIARTNDPINYSATPTAEGDICISIDPSAYDWVWETSDPLKATVAASDPESPWLVEATPISETRGESVFINGEAVGTGYSGNGELVIDFTDPTVVLYEPDCDEACINTLVRIGFNTLMDSGSILTPGNISILKCVNENCRDFIGSNLVTGISAVDEATWQDVLVQHVNFEPASYYRVIVSGEIQSETMTPLSGLNYGEDFSWTFRTRDSGELCSLSRIEIEPSIGVTESRGERVKYTALAYGEPDACSTQGQILDPEAYDWGWSVEDPNVADLIAGGAVDTASAGVSDWCGTKTCLHLGSESDIAVCGNGILEAAKGEECDDGNVSGGDGCSSRCLQEPVAQVSIGGTCGNADIEDPLYISPWSNPWIEEGEECDDGNDIFGDGCSDGCQNEGSTLAGSTCGNGDVGDGEDCDDGNRASGDGCSAECLREGSDPGPIGVCGNGAVESDLGEDCDDGNTVSGDGCSDKCLNEGSYPCREASEAGCCGNGVIDFGEDCDGGEGCGETCLLLGSSYLYSTPSFCGDGLVGAGEEAGCEAGAPDGRADAIQVAEAVGRGEVDENSNQSTIVSAATEGVIGEAEFMMLCGYELDAECKSIDPTLGLAANSCCYPMPDVVEVMPANSSNDMCRNAAIQVGFNENISRQTLTYEDEGEIQNRILVIAGQTGDCLEGETAYPIITLANAEYAGPWWQWLWNNFKNILVRVFGRIVHAEADTSIDPRRDLNYCRSNVVPGNLILSGDGKTVQYRLGEVLDPDTWYQIRVLPGIQTEDGVEMQQYWASVFGTGTEICQLDYIYLKDPTESYFFNTQDEATLQDPYGARSYIALASSRRSGLPPVAIQETPGLYEWEWSWSSGVSDADEGNILNVGEGDQEDQLVAPAGLNGEEQVTAQAKIVNNVFFGKACQRDSDCPRNMCVGATEAEAGHCAGDVISSSVTNVVNLCEAPWPDPDAEGVVGVCMIPLIERPPVAGGPCVNDADCPSRASCSFEGASMLFADPKSYHFASMYCRDREFGLLPELKVSIAEQTPGMLIDYLLTYKNPDPTAPYARDAIGFRIAPNPEHLSVDQWYRAQGFGGEPESITVDGYPAIRVGRTVYINAANKFGDPALYTNIYILSYNEGADEITLNIYNQLLQNLILNYDNVANERVCRDRFGDYVNADTDGDGDEEIVRCSANLECLGFDENSYCDADKDKLQRDLRRITELLNFEEVLQTYRTISGGRRSCTVGDQDLDYPCADDSDCAFLDKGATCEVYGGTVPNLESGSYLRTLSTSLWPSWQTELGASLGGEMPIDPVNEFSDCQVEGANYNPETCFDSEAQKFLCPEDSLIYQYRSISGGDDYQINASLEFPNYWSPGTMPEHVVWNEGCQDTVYGVESICGDGIKGPDEVCELGETKRVSCGGASVRYVPCIQDGSDCRWAETSEEGVGECQESIPVCGNGVREGFCVGGPNMDLVCRNDLDCPESSCAMVEACDDGSNNGLYGYCGAECTGSGAYCGDGLLAGGEQCDLAEANGQYNSGCSWDCKLPGPMCGDGLLQPEEQCEQGDSQTTQSAVCVSGALKYRATCETDEDCPQRKIYDEFGHFIVAEPGVCGSPCEPVEDYETERSRTCADDCYWGQWQATCSRVGSCGDGVLQAGEECDDGNDDNTDGCIIVSGREEDLSVSCKIATCGDGYRYSGIEACDAGSVNGVECEAQYGRTCQYCTERCTFATATGPYCGDGTRQNEYEECDDGPIACWYPELGDDGGYHPDRGLISCDPYGENTCPSLSSGVYTTIDVSGLLGPYSPGSLEEVTVPDPIEGVCQGNTVSYNHVPVIPPDPPLDYDYSEPYCNSSCQVVQRDEGPRCGDGVVDENPYPPLPWTEIGRLYWSEYSADAEDTTTKAGKQSMFNAFALAGRTFLPNPLYVVFDSAANYIKTATSFIKLAYGATWEPVFLPCQTDAQCPGDQVCDRFGDDPQNYCYDCSGTGCVKALESGEVCDSGIGNDIYSSTLPPNCNRTCSAYTSFCGDGIIDRSNNESCDWGLAEYGDPPLVDMVFVSTMAYDYVPRKRCNSYDGVSWICQNLDSIIETYSSNYDIEKTFYISNDDHRPVAEDDIGLFTNCIDGLIREGELVDENGDEITVSINGLPGHDRCDESWSGELLGCDTERNLFTKNYDPSGNPTAAYWSQAVVDVAESHNWRPGALRLIVVVDNNLPIAQTSGGEPGEDGWRPWHGASIFALGRYFAQNYEPETQPRVVVMVNTDGHAADNVDCLYDEDALSPFYNWKKFKEDFSIFHEWGSGAKYIRFKEYHAYAALDNLFNSIFCDTNGDGVTDCSCLAPPAEGGTIPDCL